MAPPSLAMYRSQEPGADFSGTEREREKEKEKKKKNMVKP